MKGIIKLAPVDNPVIGMKVYWQDPDTDNSCSGIYNITHVEIEDKCVIMKNETSFTQAFINELREIVVEFEKWNTPSLLLDTEMLPLHPEQLSWALAMIGHEVDFKVMKTARSVRLEDNKRVTAKESEKFAYIITPTPVYPDIEQIWQKHVDENYNVKQTDPWLIERRKEGFEEGFKACAEMYGIKLKSNNKV